MAISVLLDTHTLLWSLLEPYKLSPTAPSVIKDSETVLLVSSASAWELAIKHKLGKLSSASAALSDFPAHLRRLQANVLSIFPQHGLAADALPLHHRDPFDRMLIAQAQSEGVAIVTNDSMFANYQVRSLW